MSVNETDPITKAELLDDHYGDPSVSGAAALLPLTFSGTRIYDAKGRTVGDMRTVAGKELGQFIVDAVNVRTPAPVADGEAAVAQIVNGAKLLMDAKFNTPDFAIAWKEIEDGLDALATSGEKGGE